MPYLFIEFELEAYANQDLYSYPTNGPVYQWKEFKKLSLKDKKYFAKLYKKENITLTKLINENILPYIKSNKE